MTAPEEGAELRPGVALRLTWLPEERVWLEDELRAVALLLERPAPEDELRSTWLPEERVGLVEDELREAELLGCAETEPPERETEALEEERVADWLRPTELLPLERVTPDEWLLPLEREAPPE